MRYALMHFCICMYVQVCAGMGDNLPQFRFWRYNNIIYLDFHCPPNITLVSAKLSFYFLLILTHFQRDFCRCLYMIICKWTNQARVMGHTVSQLEDFCLHERNGNERSIYRLDLNLKHTNHQQAVLNAFLDRFTWLLPADRAMMTGHPVCIY